MMNYKRNILLVVLLTATLCLAQNIVMKGVITITGVLSTTSATGFTVMSISTSSFTPSTSNIAGLPTVTISMCASPGCTPGTYPAVGYQSGQFINNKALYFPYQVGSGGTTWTDAINNGVSQPAAIQYDGTQLFAGFSTAANWTFMDLSTLTWFSKGTTQTGNTGTGCVPPGDGSNPNCFNVPGGYISGITDGSRYVYPAPDYHNSYGIFFQYDSSKTISDSTAWKSFVPPGYFSGQMGHSRGWCSAVYDGQFIYYAPLASVVTGGNGNVFRYDTHQAFDNPSGGQTASWSNFDMRTGVNDLAHGFQAIAYDKVRYVYFIPFKNQLIVRFDTWNGGSSPDPAGFTVGSNYTTFDPTTLGSAGKPPITGVGSTTNLKGFTGQAVVIDSGGDTWLYLVPWASFTTPPTNPILQSTAARVRVAHSGTAIDITCAACSGNAAPNWQMFDFNSLISNQSWPSSWPKTYTSGPFIGQSTIAGFQEAWINTSSHLVGFVSDVSDHLVTVDYNKNLYDVTGYSISPPLPVAYSLGTMGGPYDATHNVLYPSSPHVPIFAVQLP